MGDEKWLRKIQRTKTLKIRVIWIIQVMLIQTAWTAIIQAKVV